MSTWQARGLLHVLLAAVAFGGEVIDCVAVTVGRQVIPRSAIEEQLRITAFLNREPVDLSAANRRRVAERLIDVALIRREIEISPFAAPTAGEAAKWLERIRAERGLPAAAFAEEMARYQLDEAALRRNLLLQLETLRFVELRFRPGSAVSEGEVEIYFRDTFVPEFQAANRNKPAPELDDVRERVEGLLLQQRVDQALDQWLRDARTRTRITFLSESCP